MPNRTTVVIAGTTVLDERLSLTLGELCRACEVSAEYVLELVSEGLIEPGGNSPPEWRFSGRALARVQTILRLQRDLEVNLAGAALAVDLLEEVQRLRQRVRALEQLFEEL